MTKYSLGEEKFYFVEGKQTQSSTRGARHGQDTEVTFSDA